MPVIDPADDHVYVVVDQQTHLEAMRALHQQADVQSIQRGLTDMEQGRHNEPELAFQQITARFNEQMGQ